MERLFIRLIETADHHFMAEWSLYQDDRKIVGSNIPCSVPDLKNALPAVSNQMRKVTLFIPSVHVLHTSAGIPAKQIKHAAKIVPYLIEDQLADPIQDYHIAYNAKHAHEENIEVLAVNARKLTEWLSALDACGLMPDEVFSELQLLPAVENKIYVLMDDTKCWIRSGKHIALCTEPASSASILNQIQLNMPTAQIEHVGTSPASVFEYLVSNYLSCEKPPAINILQGTFAQRSHISNKLLVKQLARIAAVWLIGMLAINTAQLAYYYYESKYYREQTLTLYKQLFPADSRIIDPRRQMETHLSANLPAASGFLGILAKVSSDVGDLAASAQNITYQDDAKLLTLTFQGKTVESINTFAEQLLRSGINAKIQSVMNTSSGVTGVLEVRQTTP